MVFDELSLIGVKEVCDKVLHRSHGSDNMDYIQFAMKQSLFTMLIEVFGSIEFFQCSNLTKIPLVDWVPRRIGIELKIDIIHDFLK